MCWQLCGCNYLSDSGCFIQVLHAVRTRSPVVGGSVGGGLASGAGSVPPCRKYPFKADHVVFWVVQNRPVLAYGVDRFFIYDFGVEPLGRAHAKI